MSSSSAYHGSSEFSSSQSDSLSQLGDILKEHPQDVLPPSADALSTPADALRDSTDAPLSLLCENTQSHMPPHNRSAARNVHIYDASDRSTLIGGLVLTAGVTNGNLYAMIEIFVIFDSKYTLQNESNIIIEKDDSLLLPGNYYINSSNPICFNNETPLTRMLSQQTGTRVQAFCDAVRLRDRRCVITGEEYLDDGVWAGLEAAHIFPLAFEGLWKQYNYGRWITSPSNGEEIAGGKINSVQNGMLLESGIHQLFDMYFFSINPDDNYKIVCFSRDRKGIAGKHLDQRLLTDPQRPVDQLLRWHFRQAVLINMKGAGEPIFEHDFPPGSDIVGSILKGPKATKRMEFELFNRLATQFDLSE